MSWTGIERQSAVCCLMSASSQGWIINDTINNKPIICHLSVISISLFDFCVIYNDWQSADNLVDGLTRVQEELSGHSEFRWEKIIHFPGWRLTLLSTLSYVYTQPKIWTALSSLWLWWRKKGARSLAPVIFAITPPPNYLVSLVGGRGTSRRMMVVKPFMDFVQNRCSYIKFQQLRARGWRICLSKWYFLRQTSEGGQHLGTLEGALWLAAHYLLDLHLYPYL